MAARSLKLPSSYEFALSRSQRFVAALGRRVVLADVPGRKRLAAWNPIKHPSHATFSNSETLLALKSTSGEIVVLALPSGEVVTRHIAKVDEGAEIHFSKCDNYLVDGSWSGSLRVRHASNLGLAAEFIYKDEMIHNVAGDAEGTLWAVAHVPKTRKSENSSAKPYFTLWRWPLEKPESQFSPGFDVLYSMSMSPCGSLISGVGYERATLRTELRLFTRAGSVVAACEISTGGTGSKVRWSPDALLVGAVTDSGYIVFRASSLSMVARVEAEYPSDLAIIESGRSMLIGTWSAGYVVPIGADF